VTESLDAVVVVAEPDRAQVESGHEFMRGARIRPDAVVGEHTIRFGGA
jgi:hypothetical protein